MCSLSKCGDLFKICKSSWDAVKSPAKQNTEEIYILSPGTDHDVIDGQMVVILAACIQFWSTNTGFYHQSLLY